MKSLSKKIVFLSPILALVISYILLNPVKFGICVETYTFGDYVGCFDKFSELLGTILLVVSFLTLPFSLATFWMKEEVFQSWFKFAVWYVPAMAIGYLLYPGGGNNSLGVVSGAYGDMFDMLIYIIAVSIFVIVSIVRILKARKRARG